MTKPTSLYTITIEAAGKYQWSAVIEDHAAQPPQRMTIIGKSVEEIMGALTTAAVIHERGRKATSNGAGAETPVAIEPSRIIKP